MSQNSVSFQQFISSGSYFLLFAEITDFNWLKARFICLTKQNKKRIVRNELRKRTAISGHVNQLIIVQKASHCKFGLCLSSLISLVQKGVC